MEQAQGILPPVCISGAEKLLFGVAYLGFMSQLNENEAFERRPYFIALAEDSDLWTQMVEKELRDAAESMDGLGSDLFGDATNERKKHAGQDDD